MAATFHWSVAATGPRAVEQLSWALMRSQAHTHFEPGRETSIEQFKSSS